MTSKDRNNKQKLALPDFCNNYALLLSMLIAQIVLTCLWLVGSVEIGVASYGLWTLYVQSLVLINCAVLCRARPRLQRLSSMYGAIVVILVGCASVLLLEYAASLLLPMSASDQVFDAQTAQRIMVTMLIFVLLLRVFALLGVLESRSKAEAQSRIHALQAKIQPHFLFNSLNTISELAATDSEQAENAIQALAMLFRVSLEEGDDLHSLDKELRLCDRYLELESWRFSPAPAVLKTIEITQPEACMVPKLLLQPLFENALKYGIAAGLSAKEAFIELSIRETKTEISIKLSNAFNAQLNSSRGHGVALENTKERLSVLFGETHSFKVHIDDGVFRVLINLPKHTQA